MGTQIIPQRSPYGHQLTLCPKCFIQRLSPKAYLVLEKSFRYSFYHILAWRPSYEIMDSDRLYNFTAPFLTEDSTWSLKKIDTGVSEEKSFKCMDEQTTDGKLILRPTQLRWNYRCFLVVNAFYPALYFQKKLGFRKANGESQKLPPFQWWQKVCFQCP